MKTHLLGIATLMAILTGVLTAEEVLLHDGPELSMGIDSLSGFKESAKELIFRKQFFIDSALLSKLPTSGTSSGDASISKEEAIKKAKATVDLGDRRDFKVVKQDLLKSTTQRAVDYYLIEMLVNGSTEHRVVLMDGSVLKPRLKRKGA